MAKLSYLLKIIYSKDPSRQSISKHIRRRILLIIHYRTRRTREYTSYTIDLSSQLSNCYQPLIICISNCYQPLIICDSSDCTPSRRANSASNVDGSSSSSSAVFLEAKFTCQIMVIRNIYNNTKVELSESVCIKSVKAVKSETMSSLSSVLQA